MTNIRSKAICWGCSAILISMPIAAIYFAFNLDLLISVAKQNLRLNIQWHTVTRGQAYWLWALTVLSVVPICIAIVFLRRAFASFANGDFFNLSNSRSLRYFSLYLFIQAIARPLHFSISSLVLSANHPAGQKLFAISFGSNEIILMALAILFWVLSDLLVQACSIDSENKQFV